MNVLASHPGINTPISTLTLDLFGLIENLLHVSYTLIFCIFCYLLGHFKSLDADLFPTTDKH